MKLTVIIVNYNVKYYVEQCLDSLEKALEGIDSSVYVVDNHSKDGSVDYLSLRFRNVEIISSNHNLGFARANNIAIRQSESDYVLLLNPDTIVGEETLREVVSFMDNHPSAGGIGVRMQNSDGTLAMESRRGLPTPLTSFFKMCGLCAKFPKSRIFGRYYLSFLGWDEPQRIEVISGAFCFLRRSALDKIGLLDEDFFMYGEDIDLSYRLLKGGYENWYLPQPILHYKGESTHKSSFRYVHVFYQAMLIFFRKHYGHLSFLISLPIKLAIYVKAMVALVKMQCDRMRKVLGFMTPRRPDPLYLFVGRKQMISRCQTIARRKGLAAEFVYANEQTFSPSMIADQVVNSKNMVILVFDTDSFSYQSMLAFMRDVSKRNIYIGTFSNKTRIIITPNEIIK